MEQIRRKKTLPKWIIISIVISTVILVLAAIWAVLTDVIILRKTEDMEGSENAISILFVGDSQVFVGNVPQQLQAIVRKYNVEIIYMDISRHGNRGGTLSELSEKAIKEMQKYKFDYIVLQVETGRSINTDGFLNDIKTLCEASKENGTIPVLYNSAWATINGKPDEDSLYTSTEIAKRAAEENDIILVNAADAWIYAYQAIPGISLYTRFDPRGPHANSAGGFLTACVFAATLFDIHIEEVPKDSMYKGSDTIDLAQSAWEFVHSLP